MQDRMIGIRRNLLLVIGFAFLALTTAYFSFGGYRNWDHKIESDGKYYYQFLVSAWQDGDLDFSNNYREVAPPWMNNTIDHYKFQNRVSQKTGRPTNVFTCGPAVLWTPFYAAARWIGLLHNQVSEQQWELGAWSRYTQTAVMFAAVVYTCLGLALLAGVARELGWEASTAPALLMILFASPLAYYAVFEPSMSHTYDFFSLSLVLWLAARVLNRPSALGCGLAALACASHILVRTQNVLTIALLIAAFIPILRIRGRVEILRLTLAVTVVAVASMPVLLINRYLFGEWYVVPQTVSFGFAFLDPWHPKLFEILFSQRNGFFSHHPFLLIGCGGFLLLLWRSFAEGRRERWFWAALAAAFVVQVYVNACVVDWWAGHSFGQRRLVSMLPIVAFGFMEISTRLRASYRRWPLWAERCVVCFAVVSGIYLAFIHVFLWSYDEPHNIWQWMFVTAPERWL